MNCENVQKNIVKYIDGEILESELDKSHIESCKECSNFYSQSIYVNNLLDKIENAKSSLCFKDLEIRIENKKIKIPVWLIAASILFAAVIGSGFGIYNNYDMNERIYDNYSNNTTYLSMVENID